MEVQQYAMSKEKEREKRPTSDRHSDQILYSGRKMCTKQNKFAGNAY